jgi:hypothetical protein
MAFIACQAIDFKRKSFAGVKLSISPYSQPAGAPRRFIADFGSKVLSAAASLHTFCGKECAQAGLCWLKYLIRFRLRSMLVFVAGPALQRPASESAWRALLYTQTVENNVRKISNALLSV